MRGKKAELILSFLAEEQRIGEIDDSLTHIIKTAHSQGEDELSDEELFRIAAAKAQNQQNPSAIPYDKEQF